MLFYNRYLFSKSTGDKEPLVLSDEVQF